MRPWRKCGHGSGDGGKPDTGKPASGSGSSGSSGSSGGGSGGSADDDDDDDADDEGEGTDPAAELAKWKALARKHERQAKANQRAAERLQEIEDAGKSELQKAQDAAAQAAKERDEARQQLLRVEIAEEKGLTLAQAKRLVGTTRDELEEDADALLKEFGTGNGSEGRAKPASGLRSRTVPGAEPEETDIHKLAEKIPRI